MKLRQIEAEHESEDSTPTREQLAWRILSIRRKAFTAARKMFEAGEPGADLNFLSAARAEYIEARDAWEALVSLGSRAA